MTDDAVELREGARDAPVVLLCDHATNRVPAFVAGGDLGLPEEEMGRHIAYDLGARGVTLELARRLSAPAILSTFSRLVIDPNRGEDDPTLVMKLYDGTIIPANRHAAAEEIAARRDRLYRPYHRRVAEELRLREARGIAPVIVSIHSFTPQLAGRPKRPWHVGVLSARDRRLADPLLSHLERAGDMVVGDNEPYHGALPGDCMDRHALVPGRRHVLIELRNDLIAGAAGQAAWAERLAPILAAAIEDMERT